MVKSIIWQQLLSETKFPYWYYPNQVKNEINYINRLALPSDMTNLVIKYYINSININKPELLD